MALRILPKTIPRLTNGRHLTSLRTSVRSVSLAANQAVRSTSHLRSLHPASARIVPTFPFTCQRRRQSNQAPSTQGQQGAVQSFPDPDRPDLFYHLFAPPTSLSSTTPVFALSFLETPPPSILSSTVLGWLPASGAGDGAGLNDFVENERFRELMHEAVQSALRDGADEVQKNGAIQTREGWMHIHGTFYNRNIPALGRIGDPDDIIASVRVEDGEIMAETYQPMPSYRLCTSDGVLQLTEGLAARLMEILQARVREEQEQN
ncbi:hypothetical protein L226DRAFT_461226 [Lentinus tigrinus ALCF2SS1-7]|uniref:Uncharacterized protein n=1 Tax=Lentinus tigrinus ALCF2SS1-6 TaxID=1328759 RepID=A0A5C2SEL7_9APHY|nr:hypothetical protein L227DRAFT_500026 [Lentinus tigrinus ALCF2SS1-6]RPD76106.1 hypothetical protein L226DRAFT_461226 [Lentinus tigrinus ALCF2SS1-7]